MLLQQCWAIPSILVSAVAIRAALCACAERPQIDSLLLGLLLLVAAGIVLAHGSRQAEVTNLDTSRVGGISQKATAAFDNLPSKDVPDVVPALEDVVARAVPLKDAFPCELQVVCRLLAGLLQAAPRPAARRLCCGRLRGPSRGHARCGRRRCPPWCWGRRCRCMRRCRRALRPWASLHCSPPLSRGTARACSRIQGSARGLTAASEPMPARTGWCGAS